MKKLIFFLLAVFMMVMITSCSLESKLDGSWINISNEAGIYTRINLRFMNNTSRGSVCGGRVSLSESGDFANDVFETFELAQEPYILDGDQLTLNLGGYINGTYTEFFVGTYTAEIKNKQLTLTDKAGNSITFDKE